MPDARDGYQYRPDSNQHVLADMAELAVRLKSIVRFDRRGDVYFMDSFENGLTSWTGKSSGIDGDVYLSSKVSYSGGYSVQLLASTDPSEFVYITRVFNIPVESSYGYSALVAIDALIKYIYLTFHYHDGVSIWQFQVRIDPSGTTVEVRDDAGVWHTVITAYPMAWASVAFYQIKVVVNLVDKLYKRLYWGLHEVDISQYSPKNAGAAAYNGIVTQAWVYGDGSPDQHLYIDDVIVTMNEP